MYLPWDFYFTMELAELPPQGNISDTPWKQASFFYIL